MRKRDLAKLIKGARLRAKLSQSQLGKRIGVAQCTVTGWEKGRCRPSADVKVALAGALRLKLADLGV